MRNEEMEKQFNKEAKQGWRFEADAARITDESASSEDLNHTSGGLFVAVDSNLGGVKKNKEKEASEGQPLPSRDGSENVLIEMLQEIMQQLR